MRHRRAPLRGLGLIEALVAATLAAALIGGLLSVVGSSTAASARIEAQRDALTLARHLLSEPSPRAESGRAGALVWTRRIERSPYDFNRRTLDGFRLQRITVEISGPALASGVSFSTERMLQ